MMMQKKFKGFLGNWITGNARLTLLAIIIFGLALRLLFFSGMGASDDLAYSRYTVNIAEGKHFDESLTLSTRLAIIYITAFSYKLMGINDFSSILFVLLASLGGISLIFCLGKLLFNEKAGLMAAFLLSFFPLDVAYATKLFTDIPSAFFMAFGVYLFLYSELKQKPKYGIGYLLSGVFIGIGYLIRESAVLIALFFIIYIAFKRRIKKEFFLVPLGVLSMFAIELLLFYALTGDPLFRMHASQQHLANVSAVYNYFGRLDFPAGLLHYPYIILTSSLTSFFYIFIGTAIVYLLAHKRKETYALMFWFLALLAYLSFGSASLTQYIPFRAVDRYLSVVTMPGILLLAFFLTEKKQVIRKIVMPLALIFLLIASIAAVYVREDRNTLDSLKAVYTDLEKLSKTIYIDERSIMALNYISGYKNLMDVRPYPDGLSDIKGAYVVINRDMVKKLRDANIKKKFPEEIGNPPAEWEVIKETGNDYEKRIIVYYVK